MLKEYLSNSHSRDLYSEPSWQEKYTQRGSQFLWALLEKKHPQIFAKHQVKNDTVQSKPDFQKFFFSYRDKYYTVRHYPARGSFKGCVLCLPPLGYTLNYFDFCFTSFQLINRCGFDVFFINYPQKTDSFEEISDDYLGQLLTYLKKKGHQQIRIWCSVGIGNVLLERNASLGQKIDLAIKINAPQKPIPLDRIYNSSQLKFPASIQHAHLLFQKKLEAMDCSLLQAQRHWCGIDKCLQEQWLIWLRVGGFMYPARENEMIYYSNPFHRNISNALTYYTTNHPFLPSYFEYLHMRKNESSTVLSEYQLPDDFLDTVLRLLK